MHGHTHTPIQTTTKFCQFCFLNRSWIDPLCHVSTPNILFQATILLSWIIAVSSPTGPSISILSTHQSVLHTEVRMILNKHKYIMPFLKILQRFVLKLWRKPKPLSQPHISAGFSSCFSLFTALFSWSFSVAHSRLLSLPPKHQVLSHFYSAWNNVQVTSLEWCLSKWQLPLLFYSVLLSS